MMYTVDIFHCGSLIQRLVVGGDCAIEAINAAIKIAKVEIGGKEVKASSVGAGVLTYEARKF